MSSHPRSALWAPITAVLVVPLLLVRQEARAQGIVPPGAGPVLRSFGGTAIAAPLDAIGALYWNPATLTAVDRRLDLGAELTWKNQNVESSIPANLLGPGNPPTPLSGKTKSQDGTVVAPSAALLIRLQGNWSNLTLSGGVFPYSGGGSDYPVDQSNPTLAGLGGWYNSFLIITTPIAAAYKLEDHFSVGLAIDPAVVSWQWSRAIFTHPDTGTLNGRPMVEFPPAFADPKFGVGVHGGAYYHNAAGVGIGLMVKSPIFFQNIHYNTAGLHGEARSISVEVNTPPFLGAGLSYDGLNRWLFALDLKYAFYKSVTGFYGNAAFFDSNGTVNGLGYKNALAITSGVQWKVAEKWTARVGYKYSTKVVPDLPTFELTSSSLRNAAGGGFSYDVTNSLVLHASYVQSWAIPITGPMTSPLNNQPIAGSRGRLTLVEYSPAIGLSLKY